MNPTSHSTSARRALPSNQRGSVLIVAVILSTGVALALGSFIALTVHSARLSQQSFYANGTLDLAEAGLEQAMNAMNREDYSGWSVHSTGPNSRYKVTANLDLGSGVTGQIKALIYDINSSSRRVVAEGMVAASSGPPVRKQVEIRATRRSLFATGLVAKDALTFSGNGVTVNSWNSDPDNDPSTPPIPYSDAVKNDHGSVGSTAVTITIGNADVWGYAATGRDQPNVGPNGTIAGFGSPEGTKDPTRITTDFKHNFDPVVVPTGVNLNVLSIPQTAVIGQGSFSLPLELPMPGYTTSIDPTDGKEKIFYSPLGISSSGNSTNVLTIKTSPYPVVIIPNAGSGADAVSITGNASIKIETGASLTIYSNGNVNIAGNGVANGGTTAATANQPKDFQIYGTNTSAAGQSISIAGNGVLSAVGYAPNASLTINGGGSSGQVMGAFVAKTVTITGGNSFHYDESLKNFSAKNPFELGSWRELFGAERATF